MTEYCDRCGKPIEYLASGVAIAMTGYYITHLAANGPTGDIILCHRCIFALESFLQGWELIDEDTLVSLRMMGDSIDTEDNNE